MIDPRSRISCCDSCESVFIRCNRWLKLFSTAWSILGVYEVEFCDADGQTYAEFSLRADQIVPLHNRGKALRVALASA